MKIIDLLNKIANGEEVHFDTKLNDKSVSVDYYNDRDFSSSTGPGLLTIADIIKSLNNEVEILEDEKKIPEKLETNKYFTTEVEDKIRNKINEIIDYLDYLKSKGE